MGKNIHKIRKKIASRRRQFHERRAKSEYKRPRVFLKHDEARDEPDFYVYYDQEKEKENWYEKDSFLFRTMISLVLFFSVAILFQNSSPVMEKARQFVREAYEKEFDFVQVANWYEQQFGRPLALVPRERHVTRGDERRSLENTYAVPASGQIRESFEENGTGVLIETEGGAYVEAVRSGFVISVGNQEKLGKTVGIEHYDGSESWYGMLSEIEVKLYDHVDVGQPVGKVATNEETGKGIFYFSLKKGDDYINPNDVIDFE